MVNKSSLMLMEDAGYYAAYFYFIFYKVLQLISNIFYVWVLFLLFSELDFLSFVEKNYNHDIILEDDTAAERKKKEKHLEELEKRDKKCSAEETQWKGLKRILRYLKETLDTMY